MPAYQIVVFNMDVLWDAVREEYHGTGTPEENESRYKKMLAMLEALGVIPLVIEEEGNEAGKKRFLVRNLSKDPKCQLAFFQRCKLGDSAQYPFDLGRIRDVVARLKRFGKVSDHAEGTRKLQENLGQDIEIKRQELELLRLDLEEKAADEAALTQFITQTQAKGQVVDQRVIEALNPILELRRQIERQEQELQTLIDNSKLAQFDYLIAANILNMEPRGFVLSDMEPIACLQLLPTIFNVEQDVKRTTHIPLPFITNDDIFYIDTQSNAHYFEEARRKDLIRYFGVEKDVPVQDDGNLHTTIHSTAVAHFMAPVHQGIASELKDLLEACARERMRQSRDNTQLDRIFEIAWLTVQRLKGLQDKNLDEKLKKLNPLDTIPTTDQDRCTLLRKLYIYAEYLYGKARALHDEADVPAGLVRTVIQAARLYDRWNVINFGLPEAQRSKGDYRVRAFLLLYDATLVVEKYQAHAKMLSPAEAKKLETYAREVSREFEYWVKELSPLLNFRLVYGAQTKQNGPAPSQLLQRASSQDASLLEQRKPIWEALEIALREHKTPITMAGLMLEFTKMAAIQHNYLLLDVPSTVTETVNKVGKPGGTCALM